MTNGTAAAASVAEDLTDAALLEEVPVARDFSARSISEQRWLVDNTWCATCEMYDLGMLDPEEYAVGDHVFIEGDCRVCGGRLKSEIVDQRGALSS